MRPTHTDIGAEYRALRESCGLVDYQGIGLFEVSGAAAPALLGQVCTRGVDFLLEGQISPALVLDAGGATLSEVAIHCTGAGYLVEVWPAQAAATARHLHAAAASYVNATTVDVSDAFAVFGVEGPASPGVVQRLLPFPVSTMAYRSFVAVEREGHPLLISRTGVTGEYGFKVHVPAAAAAELRAELISFGATEAGRAALDVCRMELRFANLEAEGGGTPGTPFDYGLQWMVDFDHDFVGRDALRASWSAGLDTAPVCWVAGAGAAGVPANGDAVTVDGAGVGAVTHAVYSPGLTRVIGTALVDRGVAASGLTFRVGDTRVDTTSAPFLVATSLGVPLE